MRNISLLSILSALCLTSYAQFDTTVDFSKSGGWQAEPGWLPNPAEIPVNQARGDSAEFHINEPRKGMKWRLVRVPDHLMTSGYFVVRYRAVDVAPSSDYLFWIFDAKPGGHSLAPLSLLKNDGQWHTLAIDLEQADVSGNVTGLAVHVQAGDQAPASLWIESLSFREDPPAEADFYPQLPARGVSIVESFDKASEWQPHTSWLDNPEESATIVDDESAVLMTVSPAGKGMKWSKRFEQPLDLAEARYVVIRYRAENLAPSGDYFVWIGSEAGGRPQEYETLLPLHQVEDDGRWHVYVAPLKKQFRIAEMAIQTQAEVSPGKAWIDYVKFTSHKPLIPMADYLPYSKGHADLKLAAGKFLTVDLSASANAKPTTLMKSLGLADWFTGESLTKGTPDNTDHVSRISIDGIPFSLLSGDKVLVSTPRGRVTPVSIAVRSPAREIYLLLGALPPTEDFSGILGGRPMSKFSDPERFVTHVRYGDGREDLAFPVRVRSGQYEVSRGLGVYCLPGLRKSPISSIALECRMPSGRLMLAGLTLNSGDPLVKRPLVSALPPAVQERTMPARRPEVALTGKSFTLKTSTLAVKFSTERGVVIESLLNKCLTGGGIRLTSGSFFELGEGDKVLTSDKVQVSGVRREGNSVVMNIDARPEVPIAGTLRLTAGELTEFEESGAILMDLNVQNVSDRVLLPVVLFPTFSRITLGDVENTWYFFPRQGGIINNVPARLCEAYSGRYPLQVTGLFNPRLGGGIYMLVHDLKDIYKYYFTDKNEEGVVWRIDHFQREYQPGERIETAETALCGNTGDWRAQLAAYRRWTKTWYKPMVPRKDWFRDVYNYRQHLVRGDLFDFKTQTYHIKDMAAKDKEFFGVSDYLHIFDFGESTIYGRVGDYSHYDEIGGKDKLAAGLAATHKAGTPVGLYIEGYLCDERGVWGRDHVKDCHIIQKDGSPLLWQGVPTEHMMCPANATWQEHLANTYRRVAGELKPKGMYIDQHGFGDAWKICWSRDHGHPVPQPPIRGERDLGRKIRSAVPAHIATLTEETPTDFNSQGQDGALGYSVAANDPRLAPHRVDLFRFAFPDFKIFQLVAYNDFIEGGWGLLKFPFFNGEGWWLGNGLPGGFEPAARQFLRKAFRILHTHADAFRSGNPQPLVPTLNPLIYANVFPTKKETVWTLFNSDYCTYRGPVLEVEPVIGATYRDEWNGVEIKPVVKGNRARLSVTIGPREVGCVVRSTRRIAP